MNKELIVVAPWSARKRPARRVRRPICIEPDCDRDAAWETFAGMWGPLAWYCDDHLPDDCEREP